MKLDRWQQFDEATREAMDQAAREVSLASWLQKGVLDIDAMVEMAKTNEILELEPEVVQRVKELGRDWAARKASEHPDNPWIKRVADAHFAFQDRWDTWKWVRL